MVSFSLFLRVMGGKGCEGEGGLLWMKREGLIVGASGVFGDAEECAGEVLLGGGL